MFGEEKRIGNMQDKKNGRTKNEIHTGQYWKIQSSILWRP